LIKKLNLTEFLSQSSIVSPIIYQPKEDANMGVSLVDFYNEITHHMGIFIINEKVYSSVIPSSNNLYFFKESTNDEYIIIFNPIEDIKKKGPKSFTVFYYPNTIINILLKDLI
jgi:hypothetical protein